ncbi:MAG: hypothetical protein LBC74_07590 [Planctomycetaceae bacterium]|nr:hypothetical protein [Planctomycetaceae bacterium]
MSRLLKTKYFNKKQDKMNFNAQCQKVESWAEQLSASDPWLAELLRIAVQEIQNTVQTAQNGSEQDETQTKRLFVLARMICGFSKGMNDKVDKILQSTGNLCHAVAWRNMTMIDDSKTKENARIRFKLERRLNDPESEQLYWERKEFFMNIKPEECEKYWRDKLEDFERTFSNLISEF